MFGVLPRQLRGDTGRNEHTFWATRGKRAGMMDMVIKPNGFFNVGKRGFKPNGLFNIKRMGFKPNMFNVNKRSFKPNGLFNIKRSFMKPNGLFATFEGGKRSWSIKPNGLFSLTKRSLNLQNDVVDREPLEDVSMLSLPFHFTDRDNYWGSPMGLFGSYKRSMKPNGLFTIDKRTSDTEYDDIEDDDEDLVHVLPVKRGTFWATRGKREPEVFWATKGITEPGNFWAVRG